MAIGYRAQPRLFCAFFFQYSIVFKFFDGAAKKKNKKQKLVKIGINL